MSSPGGPPDPNAPYSGYSGYPNYSGYSGYSGYPGYQGYPQSEYSVDPLTGQPVASSHSHPGGGFGAQGSAYTDPYHQSQGYPGMIGAQPRRGKKSALTVIGATAGFVLIVALGVLGVWLGGGFGGSSGVAGPEVPPETKQPAKHPAPPPPTTPSEPESKSPSSYQDFVPANTPGWKGISWPKYGVAYDVPPSWNPKRGGISGVESPDGAEKQTMGAYSLSQEDVCGPHSGSSRAKAGISSIKEPDPAKAADTALRSWARLGFTTESGQPPQVAAQPPAPVTVDGRQGFLASAVVTPAQPMPCSAPNTVISVLTLGNDTGTGSAAVVGIADQGVPGATSPEDLQRVLTSLRWLPH